MKLNRRLLAASCLTGCLTVLLLFMLVIGTVILFITSNWGPIAKVRHTLTAPVRDVVNRLDTQTFWMFADELASEEAFYSVRGDIDYTRLPLRYPWSLGHFSYNEPIALLDGTSIKLDHVVAIGYQSGFFAGIDIAVKYSDQRIEASPSERIMRWFLLTPENHLRLFDTEDEFLAVCRSHRLKPFDFHLSLTMIQRFSSTGSCMPLFDIREVKGTSPQFKAALKDADEAQQPYTNASPISR